VRDCRVCDRQCATAASPRGLLAVTPFEGGAETPRLALRQTLVNRTTVTYAKATT